MFWKIILTGWTRRVLYCSYVYYYYYYLFICLNRLLGDFSSKWRFVNWMDSFELIFEFKRHTNLLYFSQGIMAYFYPLIIFERCYKKTGVFARQARNNLTTKDKNYSKKTYIGCKMFYHSWNFTKFSDFELSLLVKTHKVNGTLYSELLF